MLWAKKVLVAVLAVLCSQAIARAQCGSDLDDVTLHALSIPLGLSSTIELAPGGSTDLYVWDYINLREITCVRWSISQFENQETIPVTVDPQRGVVTVAQSARAGWKFDVIANVDGGRRYLVRHGLVFDPSANPLVGAWQEESRYACETGERIHKGAAVRLLEFHADGTFVAASIVIPDGPVVSCGYAGRYTIDRASGRILLEVVETASTGDVLRPAGAFRIDADGRLTLKGVSFGTLCGGPSPRACRYVFARIDARPN